MQIGKTFVAALAGFLAFAPVTFIWHTVLFAPYYLGPEHSVKSADAFDPKWIVAAAALLCLSMAFFVPSRLQRGSGRVAIGALLGAVFASVLIDYHNFSLIGLFPGQDPASLYVMDALWAIVDGAIAGAVITAIHDWLDKAPPQPQRASFTP
jgi:hypothetical protein